VYETVGAAIRKIRAGEGPQFIEAQTVRWPGSVSNWPVLPVETQIALAWDLSTVPEAVKEWYQFSDPVLSFIRNLTDDGHASREEIVKMERAVKDQVAGAIKFAFDSPEPDPKSALEGIFAERRS